MVEGGILDSKLTTKNNWLASPMFSEDAKILKIPVVHQLPMYRSTERVKFKQSRDNNTPQLMWLKPQQDNTGWHQYWKQEFTLYTPLGY